MKLEQIRTMISKWIMEDKLNDQHIGYEIRKYYWREIHSYEHWLNEENQPTDVLDYMYGGGDDVEEDKSSDGEEYGDSIYGPI